MERGEPASCCFSSSSKDIHSAMEPLWCPGAGFFQVTPRPHLSSTMNGSIASTISSGSSSQNQMVLPRSSRRSPVKLPYRYS